MLAGGITVADVELSVVIPARNVAPTIAEQVAALAAQDWEGDWEVVVVDNGSTDGTADSVRRAQPQPPRLRVVPATSGTGISYARNVGAGAATGRAIAFCDGDDVVTPGWVRSMATALRSSDLVTGPLLVQEINPGPLGRSRGLAVEQTAPTFYGVIPYAHGCNLGVRRAVWEALGGFDETWTAIGEDIEFALRATLRGHRVTFEPDAAVHYRYRTSARELWRQGLRYGVGRAAVARRARDLGLDIPRLPGLRSWVWLVVTAPTVALARRRLPWLWVAANRLGQLVGCVRSRVLCL